MMLAQMTIRPAQVAQASFLIGPIAQFPLNGQSLLKAHDRLSLIPHIAIAEALVGQHTALVLTVAQFAPARQFLLVITDSCLLVIADSLTRVVKIAITIT